MTEPLDLVVIGAGPGGYVAAIRAAQLGWRVAVVEREAALGGTCLRVGCIPSKALLESSELFRQAGHGLAEHGIRTGAVKLDLGAMMERKQKTVTALTKGIEGLLRKNRIQRVVGNGSFQDAGRVRVTGKGGEEILEARHVLIATGSKPATLPGIEWDGEYVGHSTHALAYAEVPGRLVVIGAGAIGLELGSVWSRLGAEVTVLEYLDRILPGMDAEIAGAAHQLLKAQGLSFHLGTRVTAVQTRRRGKKTVCSVESEGHEPLACERVLVAVGRAPCTDDLGLENIGLELDARGRVPVNEHFATSVAGVYAIGDVIAGPMLAHKAEEEGIACVEKLIRGHGHVNYDAIPSIVYTAPEVASVGQTEEQLQEAGVAYRKGTFPFLANGRARAIGHTDGMVKMLADAETDRILGVHIVGPHAGDLIAEAAVAIEFGASSEDVARAVHAHPTLAEAVKEAALGVDGRALHL